MIRFIEAELFHFPCAILKCSVNISAIDYHSADGLIWRLFEDRRPSVPVPVPFPKNIVKIRKSFFFLQEISNSFNSFEGQFIVSNQTYFQSRWWFFGFVSCRIIQDIRLFFVCVSVTSSFYVFLLVVIIVVVIFCQYSIDWHCFSLSSWFDVGAMFVVLHECNSDSHFIYNKYCLCFKINK